MATKRKNKGAYMISSVAEMYDIHPQTLRLYEREGLLRPSRSDGNTRLYTDLAGVISIGPPVGRDDLSSDQREGIAIHLAQTS